jgi:hypothetical protein
MKQAQNVEYGAHIWRGARRSVSRVLSRPGDESPARGWPFISDVRYRTPRATDPSGGAEGPPGGSRQCRLPPAAPTWSCSRWGFPCRPRCRRRGALLPHHFTLAFPCHPTRGSSLGSGGMFSVALSLGSPPPGVTRHRASVEPGLSSPRRSRERPSDRLAWDHVGNAAGRINDRAATHPLGQDPAERRGEAGG